MGGNAGHRPLALYSNTITEVTHVSQRHETVRWYGVFQLWCAPYVGAYGHRWAHFGCRTCAGCIRDCSTTPGHGSSPVLQCVPVLWGMFAYGWRAAGLRQRSRHISGPPDPKLHIVSFKHHSYSPHRYHCELQMSNIAPSIGFYCRFV